MSTQVSPPPGDVSASATAKPGYRFDLDGLRAFAIVLVVIYHVWVGRVSGGVDVFLMLSAYFMTASLVRRGEKTLRPGERGGLALGAFYARRFWRLVPAAATTIALTLVAVYLVFPRSSWPDAWSQSIASLFYFQNWELALNSVDYYARDADGVTPFLHFWSLSIQGQVFILWPLLLLLCWAIARLTTVRLRTVALVVFGLVFAASLAYSVVTTRENQAFAYFDTAARLWEFALGSLVALIPASFALPRPLAEIVSWTAVAGIVTCGIVLDVSGGFPGYLALWPTLCAAALIIGGRTGTSTASFLGSAPLRWLGRIAYALYLVHWPILTCYIVVTGNARPDLGAGAAIIGISFVLAIALHYLVERPLGSWAWPSARAWRGYVATAACFGLVAGGSIGWQSLEERRALSSSSADNPGAAAVLAGRLDEWDPRKLIPDATQLDAQWVYTGQTCPAALMPRGPAAAETCMATVADDDAPVVLVLGDSHAEQWMGTLLPELESREVTIITFLKGGCRYTPDHLDAMTDDCDEWVGQVADYVADVDADLVMLMGTQAAVSSPEETRLDNIDQTVRDFTDRGTSVVLVRDNPRFDENKYTCLEQNLAEPLACAVPRGDALADESPLDRLAGMDDVFTLDMTDVLCPEGLCRVAIGNVAVYLDDNHITWDFARTMAPIAAERLTAAGLIWPGN